MALHIPILSLVFILALLFLCSEAHDSQLSTTQESSTSSGFSLDLIHREYSPLSPFYDPVATDFDRLKNVIRRSNSRVSYLQSKSKNPSSSYGTIESEIVYDDSLEYLMKLQIGTPPVETLGIADTGSDLTWIQCKPCNKCFNHIYPLYDLRASSSYKTLKCTSKQCKAFTGHTGTCSRKHNKCQYNVFYGDGSFSNGHLATEKLTFGKTSIEKVAFGCGHYNQGTFGNSSSGIVGLGRGPLSIISQLDETIQGKFSYCLVTLFRNTTSTISFGEKAEVLNSNAVSTPLIENPGEVYYYLYLEKVIIGNKSFELKPGKDTGGRLERGNIIIDSGTTLTYLPNGTFYHNILSALREAIGVETIKDPEGFFDLCYKTSSNIKVPVIGLQFKGATLKIPQSSTFVEVDDGITCFSVVPSDFSIFGNILQQNFLVSYDLQKKVVSFQATDCSKK